MFRGAVRGDLPQILQIYAHAREAMAASGNPTQWGDNFPPQELLEEDIDSNRLFVYVLNGQLLGVFAFILGGGPHLSGDRGRCMAERCPALWHHPSAGLLRQEQGGGFSGHRVVSGALPEPAGGHPCRQPDHAASAGKNGFTRCGIIHVADGTPRIAYQKLALTQQHS